MSPRLAEVVQIAGVTLASRIDGEGVGVSEECGMRRAELAAGAGREMDCCSAVQVRQGLADLPRVRPVDAITYVLYHS